MKKAIIIGATSGIGKGLAEQLVSKGYKVGITGRRTNLLEQLQSEKPEAYLIKTFDICDTPTAMERLNELVQELGGLDLLIISSGTGDINPELDFAIEKRTIDTNIVGFTAIADWVFRFFEAQKHGHLVAISSIGGLRGSRHAPAYNASKAYQINYLEGLRQKAQKIGKQITITDIRPGLVDTDMAKGDGLFWVMPVSKVVKQTTNAIEKRKKVAYVTRRWRVLAGIMKRLPNRIFEKM
jgi:short-subunit dehydrogenase